MKKALFYWFAFLALLLIFTSCKSHQPIIQKEIVKDSIVVKVYDTIFNIEKDSSSLKALLECQNGRIVLKEIKNENSGRALKTPKILIKDNFLQVDCFSEAQKKFATWKETFVKSYKEINKPIVTNILSWWQKTQIYIGRTALVLLAIWILSLIYKFNKI